MTYVKTYIPMLKTHIVYLKRDAKDLSRDLQRLEVRSKLESKALYGKLASTCQAASLWNETNALFDCVATNLVEQR